MTDLLRVVLDTNVLVSITLKQAPSIPDSIFQAAAARKFILLASPSIITEIEEVINRKEILERSPMTVKQRKLFVKKFLEISVSTVDDKTIMVVRDDPDDDKFIACAVSGKADFIVSGDKHLLKIKKYEEIKIVSPKDFLDYLP